MLKFFLLLLLGSLGLSACATAPAPQAADLPGVSQREGLTGTAGDPATLNPFKHYDLVLAAGENRYFQVDLPQGWYWKLFVTAVDSDDNDGAELKAGILPAEPAWRSLPLSESAKDFKLKPKEGDQQVLGVANLGPDRMAVVELSQTGAPVQVSLRSEISPLNDQLMRPFGFNPGRAWPSAGED
ncbi:MAG TPA: hypothetical protein VMU88_07030 [bacterium]|nr:hypothetical protein [bacterium]